MVQNFSACTTAVVGSKLGAITCAQAKTDACLSSAQVTALETVLCR